MRWAARRLPHRPSGVRVLELGCGPGRDLLFLVARGATVRGIDFAPTAIGRARAALRRLPPAQRRHSSVVEADALGYLRGAPSKSFDAVYAHLAYGTLPLDDLVELFASVRRTLRIGGVHLYGARTTSDPLCGRGKEVAPNVWFGGPHDVPFRYFTRATCDTLGRGFFERVALGRSRADHLLYVADRRVL